MIRIECRCGLSNGTKGLGHLCEHCKTQVLQRDFRLVIVAGGFDPIHSGHIDHIKKATLLGDVLMVITHRDQTLSEKKGFCLLPIADRFAVLKELRSVHRVVEAIDTDGTVAETLRKYRPDIFAKGGDRDASSMPENELKVCDEIGCQIFYGIGDLLNSSTDLVRTLTKEGI